VRALISIFVACVTAIIGIEASLHASSMGWSIAFAISVGTALYLFLRGVGPHAAASVLRTKLHGASRHPPL
jgi:hypothetical protein